MSINLTLKYCKKEIKGVVLWYYLKSLSGLLNIAINNQLNTYPQIMVKNLKIRLTDRFTYKT